MSSHPDLYTRVDKTAQWVYDSKTAKYEWTTETKTLEFDLLLRDWIKTKSEKTTETPEQHGFFKEIKFAVVFPDDSEPTKRFGKSSSKTPKLLIQLGTVKVREDQTHTWLMKQHQNPITFEGATGQNRIYVKTLSGTGVTYRFEYLSDERVTCKIGNEKEITLSQLKTLEAKGLLIAFHGKATFSESEGFQYGTVAFQKNL